MSTTYAELASNVRANQTTLSIERSELNRKLQSLAGRVENRDPNDAEAAQIRSFTARKAELDEQYEDLEVSASQFEREAKIEAQNRAEYNALPQSEQVQRDRKYTPGISIGAEPTVYNRGSAAGRTEFL